MSVTQQEVNIQLTIPWEEATTNYPTAPESEALPIVSTEATATAVKLGGFPEIADLVKIDDEGRGHITSNKSNGKKHSRFISYYDMGVIAANHELIRLSLPERYLGSGWSTQAVQQPDKPMSEPVLPGVSKVALSSKLALPAEIDLKLMEEFPKDLADKKAYALNEWSGLVVERERSIITLGAKSAENVRAAQRRYERLRRESKSWTAKKMGVLGLAESSRVEISRREDLSEAKLAALSIKKHADRLARPTGKLSKQRQQFYDWWARQGGGDKFFSRQRLTGTVKKATVMAAIGLPIGVVAGTAGIFIGGPILGAATAAGVSRGVARNLIRGRVDRNVNSRTVSDAQYEKRLAAQSAKIDMAYKIDHENAEQIAKVLTVTDIYAETTAMSVRRNRLRLMGGVVISAAFGAAGGLLGDLAHDALFGNVKPPSAVRPQVTTSPSPRLEPNPITPHMPVKTHAPHHVKPPVISQTKSSNRHQLPPKPNQHIKRPPVPPPIKPIITSHPRPALHGIIGQEFYVKPGGGEISEIQAYASSHNYSVTPVSADQIYQELYAQHGSDIIKLDGNGPSTYLIAPGDIGLSHPGPAYWSPGIENELRDLLAKDAA